MANTTYIDGSAATPIMASWLNDVNKATYAALGSGGVAPTTPDQVKANIGADLASMSALRSFSGATQATVRSYYEGGSTGGGNFVSASSTTGWYGVGAISGTTLTVSSTTNGAPAIGQQINYAGSDGSAYIVSGSGTSWILNKPLTVTATTMTGDDGGSVIVALDGMRWYRIFQSAPDLRDFGAVGNGFPVVNGTTGTVTVTGSDDTYAFTNFWKYLAGTGSAYPVNPTGAKRAHVSAGGYILSGSQLFHLTSAYSGLILSGDGMYSTMFFFTNNSSGMSAFYHNEAVDGTVMRTWVEDAGFVGVGAATSTQTFDSFTATGGSTVFRSKNIMVYGFNQVFDQEGTAAADLSQHYSLTLRECNNGMKVNNPQSVVHDFYSPDIITPQFGSGAGDVITLNDTVEINIYGGSIITFGTQNVVHTPSTATGSPMKVKFIGMKPEIRGSGDMLVKQDAQCELYVEFLDVDGGTVVPTTKNVISLQTGGVVSFVRGILCGGVTLTSSSTAYTFRPPVLDLDGTQWWARSLSEIYTDDDNIPIVRHRNPMGITPSNYNTAGIDLEQETGPMSGPFNYTRKRKNFNLSLRYAGSYYIPLAADGNQIRTLPNGSTILGISLVIYTANGGAAGTITVKDGSGNSYISAAITSPDTAKTVQAVLPVPIAGVTGTSAQIVLASTGLTNYLSGYVEIEYL